MQQLANRKSGRNLKPTRHVYHYGSLCSAFRLTIQVIKQSFEFNCSLIRQDVDVIAARFRL